MYCNSLLYYLRCIYNNSIVHVVYSIALPNAGQPAASAGTHGGGGLLHPPRGRAQRGARLVGHAARARAQLPRQLPALDRRSQGTADRSPPLMHFHFCATLTLLPDLDVTRCGTAHDTRLHVVFACVGQDATGKRASATLFTLLGKTQMKATLWKDAVLSFESALLILVCCAQVIRNTRTRTSTPVHRTSIIKFNAIHHPI